MRARWMMLVGLLLAACSGNEAEEADAPIPVRVAQVQRGGAANIVTGAGTIAYRIETPMGFTTAGRIARVLVQEGDRVRPGQMLAALDSAPVDANLVSARAELVRAQAELRRSEALLKQGWVTQIRVDNARASAQAAAAQVRAAGFQSATARILSPTGGEVLSRGSEPGQVVAAGTPVLVLGEARGGLVMRVALNDKELGRVSRGATAEVRVAALGPDAITGTVIEVGGRAERSTGAFLAEVSLPDDARLRSGMIGSARIAAAPAAGTAAPVIPPAALFAARAGEAFVYIVGKDDRVRLRKVAIAETGDAGAAIASGLVPGEWVAVSSIDRLRDGLRVSPERRSR